MSSHTEHCIMLGVDPNHQFEGPFLNGACIHCDRTAKQHIVDLPVLIQNENKIMEPLPAPGTEPLFKITTSLDGSVFLTSLWQPIEAAVETFKAVCVSTTLDVSVVMRIKGEEVDLLKMAEKFSRSRE